VHEAGCVDDGEDAGLGFGELHGDGTTDRGGPDQNDLRL
jgi:hypothetical protein